MHRTRRILVWSLAVTFLAIETLALAHEIQHDLRQHESSCALHIYAGELGKTPTAVSGVALANTVQEFYSIPISGPIFSLPALGYHVRAPPSSSVRSL